MITFPRHLLAASVALLGFSTLSGAQTVATDPVGFITLNVSASSGSTPSLSFKGLGLARPIEFQGVATATTGNTISVAPGTWTAGKYDAAPYYVEIVGVAGTGAGTMYDVTTTADSATASTITLSQNLAAAVGATPNFRIRPHWTVATVFGANNEGGLLAGSATTADLVRVYNQSTKAFDAYFYSNTAEQGNGWRMVNGGTTAKDNTIIYPDDALLIYRLAATPLNLVIMGAVKTGQTSFPVLPGLNVLTNPYAAPMTLQSSGLYTGGVGGLKGGTASTADLVQIFNGTDYDIYFYSTAGLPGTGWRKAGAGAADQSNVQIPMGSSFVVKRAGGTAFDWTLPQHPSTF